MSFFDSLFGGESTKGIRFQQADNERRQDFLEEMSALARQDILDIIPRGNEALQQGYRAATDISRRAPMAQLRSLARSSHRGEEALLGGLNEFRRATLGLPSGMDPNNYHNNPQGLTPYALAEEVDPGNPFYSSQQPLFLSSQDMDRKEYAMRRNNPDDYWETASPNKDVNLFPEQFRESPRYNFDKKRVEGGVGSTPTHQANVRPNMLAGRSAFAAAGPDWRYL